MLDFMSSGNNIIRRIFQCQILFGGLGRHIGAINGRGLRWIPIDEQCVLSINTGTNLAAISGMKHLSTHTIVCPREWFSAGIVGPGNILHKRKVAAVARTI